MDVNENEKKRGRKMKEYQFVYMTDKNYVMPTVISICSLLSNKSAESKYYIHLILDDVPEKMQSVFSRVQTDKSSIILHQVDGKQYESISKKISVSSIHVTRTDMLKFELANYLSDVECVLYLDGDLIVNKCIEPVFDTDISNAYVAAVCDMGDQIDEKGGSRIGRRIGLPKIRYFNAGVMYLNLRKMREEQIGEKLWEYRTKQKNYFMSQDALNFVLRDGRVELPFCYNFLSKVLSEITFDTMNDRYFHGKYKSIQDCLKDLVIIHMTDKMKPWIYYMPWVTEIFMFYYKMSPYADQKITLSSPLVKKEQMMREMLWGIFKNNIKRGERIILYGAGKRGLMFQQFNKMENYCDIVLWVDRCPSLDLGIMSPESIKDVDYDKLVIAAFSPTIVEEIRNSLFKIDVPKEKIYVIG